MSQMNKEFKKKKTSSPSKIPLWTTLAPEASAIIDSIGKKRHWTRPQVGRYLLMKILEKIASEDPKQDPIKLMNAIEIDPFSED